MRIVSPLRYPGGKSKAVSQIVSLIPDFEEYREPFLGGGSVFLAVKGLFPHRKYWINDLNTELYLFWRVLQTRPKELIQRVRVFREAVDGRALFTALKSMHGTGNDLDRAARFFVLNRIGYSGMTDSGGYSEDAFRRLFSRAAVRRLEETARALRSVQVTNLDYQSLLESPGENVFLFMDPPYYGVAKPALYGKDGDLHERFDHERFAEACRACPHRWLITYDDHPVVRELFRGFEMRAWTLRYSIRVCSKVRSRLGRELFIANYELPSPPEQLAIPDFEFDPIVSLEGDA